MNSERLPATILSGGDQNDIEKPVIDSLRSTNLSRIGSLLYLLILVSGSSHAGTAYSTGVRPLYSFNQSPLIQIYGLPALGETRVLAQDESDIVLRLQISNNFTGGKNLSEYLILDGETHRLTLTWRQGLADGREWGFELPFLTHNGGLLDSSIERFHETFSLSQNGRRDIARNQINYRYTRYGVDLIRVTEPVSGVGDIRLLGAKQIKNHETSGLATALRVSLKLPTGRESELLGSGSTDLAVWLSMATTHPPSDWNKYGGGGILLMSEGKVLPRQQRNQVVFGALGIGRSFFPHMAINAQLDAHSSFYDYTHFRQLNSYAVQGSLGLNWELAPRKFLELSISEDLVVNTSPDVVFTLALTLPF